MIRAQECGSAGRHARYVYARTSATDQTIVGPSSDTVAKYKDCGEKDIPLMPTTYHQRYNAISFSTSAHLSCVPDTISNALPSLHPYSSSSAINPPNSPRDDGAHHKCIAPSAPAPTTLHQLPPPAPSATRVIEVILTSTSQIPPTWRVLQARHSFLMRNQALMFLVIG